MKIINKYRHFITFIVLFFGIFFIVVGANMTKFYSLYFFDDKNGWAVGTSYLGDNKILYTKDGGATWINKCRTSLFFKSLYIINSNGGWVAGFKDNILWGKLKSNPLKEQLEQICFSDPNNGWILGYKGTIFYTNDGGNTWKEKISLRKVYENLNSKKRGIFFYGIHFIDTKNGWVVGDKGTILYTKDGGDVWYGQKNITNKDLQKICFTDNKNGWIIGTGIILHTDDGGLIWKKQNTGISSHFWDIHFADPNNGWTAGTYSGAILCTKDGGKTWKRQNTEKNFQPLAIHFSDMKNGWAVGSGGEILHTSNGGHVWNKQVSGVYGDLYAVQSVNNRNAWLSGSDGIILHTKDGGITWEKQKNSNMILLFSLWFFIAVIYSLYLSYIVSVVRPLSIHFTNLNNGWATGKGGTFLNSSDGGITWNVIKDMPAKEVLVGLHFPNEHHGWIVGDTGTILHTRNRGLSWEIQESNTSQNLNGVYFLDVTHGWIVGNSGTVLNTKNGGISWTIQEISNNNLILLKLSGRMNFNAVYFSDNNNGWIASNGGKIFRTENGGVNWDMINVGSIFDDIYGVHFVDDKHGWAVGLRGIYVTDDGGKIWLLQKQMSRIIGIQFLDTKTGWVSGGIGTILYTKDGGLTWTEQKSNSFEYIERLYFSDPENGWIIRADGKVLYTKNGGQKWEIAKKYGKMNLSQ